MRLLLIRHGATSANAAHLYCGSTDISLLDESRQALSQLHYPAADRYVSSGMKRSDETLSILFPGAAFERMEDLREMDFGAFEMKSYNELKDCPAYIDWITGDNETNVCPGGESGRIALLRALKALERLIADGVDTAVVTHGGVIAGAMAAWFPQTGKNRYEWQPKPGFGYAVQIENGFPISYTDLNG